MEPAVDEWRNEKIKQLHSMWEFASVVAFLDTFGEILRVKSVQPWVRFRYIRPLPRFPTQSYTCF